jgi:hypothetical protein
MEIEHRNKWIGILAGACFVASGFYIGFLLMDLLYSLIIFFLVGGFITGMLAPGYIKEGIKSGFMCGLIGSIISAMPLVGIFAISLISKTADFVLGLGILFMLVFTALAVLFASAGAVLGALTKRKIFGGAK